MENNLSPMYILIAILCASLSTAATRVLPYFVLKNKENHKLLEYLQETMPLLIMTLLVFFSLQEVDWVKTYGIYEILGILSSILCFLWFKNSVFSIFTGIIIYMILIRIF
ncbi:MAG: AzlD domain-containing protein [Helicobacter sp.]|nr:AzlD domain-containing protein [Helicobacter sp.]